MWGKGNSLAAKLRADPELKAREAARQTQLAQQRQDRLSALQAFQSIRPVHVHEHHHFTRLHSDGCVHPPQIVRLQDNTTMMLAVLILDRSGQRVLLRRSQTAAANKNSTGVLQSVSSSDSKGIQEDTTSSIDVPEDGSWYVPVTEVLPRSGGLTGALQQFDLVQAILAPSPKQQQKQQQQQQQQQEQQEREEGEKEEHTDNHNPSCVSDLFSLVVVENYPTLRHNWLRCTVSAVIPSAEHEARADEFEELCWVDVNAVIQGDVPLERQDVVPMLEAVQRSQGQRIPLPSPQPALYGFPYMLVEVLLTRKQAVALVYIQPALSPSSSSSSSSSAPRGFWSLPVSHVDRGENIGFTASRLIYGITKVVAKPETIVHVAYQGHTGSQQTESKHDENCPDGTRFTLHASVDEEQEEQEQEGKTTTATKQQEQKNKNSAADAIPLFQTTNNNNKHGALVWATLPDIEALHEQGSVRNDVLSLVQRCWKNSSNAVHGAEIIQVVTK